MLLCYYATTMLLCYYYATMLLCYYATHSVTELLLTIKQETIITLTMISSIFTTDIVCSSNMFTFVVNDIVMIIIKTHPYSYKRTYSHSTGQYSLNSRPRLQLTCLRLHLVSIIHTDNCTVCGNTSCCQYYRLCSELTCEQLYVIRAGHTFF